MYKIARDQGMHIDLIDKLLQVASVMNQHGDQSECAAVIYEVMHYTMSHRVINVSANLAERLVQTEMDLNLEHLRIPSCLFEICFEQGTMVPNSTMQMPSCLIVAKPDDAVISAIHSWMEKVSQRCLANELEDMSGVRLDTSKIKMPVYVEEEMRNLFAVKYRDPTEPDDLLAALCHSNLNLVADAKKPIKQAIDELPLMQHSAHVMGMTERDKLIQKHIVTTVLAAISYMNTTNPDMKDYKFKDRPRVGTIPPKATVLGGSFQRCPPGWHLRKPHMRHLWHERFKRDEGGNVRVVWIHTVEVGKGRLPAGQAVKEMDVEQEVKPTEQPPAV
jgi:hypothetical protein